MSTQVSKSVIKRAQKLLGVVADGVWGNKSKQALIDYQRKNLLVADGILGPKTLEKMGILDTDTCLYNKLGIEKRYLSKDQYITSDVYVKNEYLILHHTAGWNNPFDVISGWENDSCGRIATEFVIGGQNIKNGDKSYDGRIVQAFPEGCQGYHIGSTKSQFLNLHSVGIEMCNFGYLTESNRTYTGALADPNQVCVLSEPFRGYTHWHKYSDDQLKALRKLILYIADRDEIDVRAGLIERIQKNPKTAFDYSEDIASGKIKGMFSHGNIRSDKFDVYPQPELIDMLLTL